MQVRDLLNENYPKEARHAVLSLFTKIATTAELGQRRFIFLKYIMDNYMKEDPNLL